MADAANIAALLERTRFLVSDEKAVQAAIAERLDGASIPHEREARLSGADIVDFLAGDVAVEVKIKGSRRAILRQLERYAEHETVGALILVSNLAMGLPSTIRGKPALFVSIGRGWL